MYLKSWIQKILQSLQNFLESRFKIEGLHQEPKTKIHLKSPGGILVLGLGEECIQNAFLHQLSRC